MALTIEDGSIVSGANSYITDAEFTAYADARSVTYAATAELREPFIIKAMDYLESFEYDGYRVEPDNQLFNFPRHTIYANGRWIVSTTIPREIKNAQIEAAIAAISQDLLITSTNQNIQKEKLDVMEVSYFSRGKNSKVRLDSVNRWLCPFLIDTAKLVRV